MIHHSNYLYFCANMHHTMETITIQYDNQSQQLKDLIAALIEAGAVVIEKHDTTLAEDDEREAFLHTSKINAAKMFEKLL